MGRKRSVKQRERTNWNPCVSNAINLDKIGERAQQAGILHYRAAQAPGPGLRLSGKNWRDSQA